MNSIQNIPEGFVWKSGWEKVSRMQALWFAIATGDWNRVHFNPFTWFLYRSNLGGQTVTGDMLLSLTKKGALKMVEGDDTEVVAYGYEQVKFLRPLHVGARFQYTYTLIKKETMRQKTVYHWAIEVCDQSGKLICRAVWKAGYMPVEKSSIGNKAFPVLHRLPQIVGAACVLLLAIGVWQMSKNPPRISDEVITFGHPAAVAF